MQSLIPLASEIAARLIARGETLGVSFLSVGGIGITRELRAHRGLIGHPLLDVKAFSLDAPGIDGDPPWQCGDRPG